MWSVLLEGREWLKANGFCNCPPEFKSRYGNKQEVKEIKLSRTWWPVRQEQWSKALITGIILLISSTYYFDTSLLYFMSCHRIQSTLFYFVIYRLCYIIKLLVLLLLKHTIHLPSSGSLHFLEKWFSPE